MWFSYSCSFCLSFYASSANKPVFLCFTSPSLSGFYVSINFYRRGTLDFKWHLGMIEWGQKSKPKKSLNQNWASKQSHAKFPSQKNFHKALNGIPSGYSYGTRSSTCICYSHEILAKLIRVKHWQYWLGLNHAIICLYYTTHKRFVIFTCRYFKSSWNVTTLSQSNCRNFSYSSIGIKITNILISSEYSLLYSG